jgi:hypothetical protein
MGNTGYGTCFPSVEPPVSSASDTGLPTLCVLEKASTGQHPEQPITDPVLSRICRRPVTLFVGHFGSGKTEISANLAIRLRQAGEAVTLVDLDVVKPYLRLRLLIDELTARSIELVAPGGDQLYADLPIVVPEVRGAVGRAAAGLRRVIIDVGGADVGSRVLGSVPGLDDPAVSDVLFVVNGNRPFAESPQAVERMLREVEAASKLKVTGLVANSHLMDQTTVETVRDGVRLARTVGLATGLALRFCAATAAFAERLGAGEDGLPVLVIERHIMPPLDLRRPGLRRRSGIV